MTMLDLYRNNLDKSSSPFLNAFYYCTEWERRLALECFFNTGYSSHFCPLYN